MSQISVNNLTFCYPGSYDNIFENVNFNIDTDWKLGFCGRNGRGKTTFLNLLLGKYEYSGSINAGVSFDIFPYSPRDHGKRVLDVMREIAPDAQEWQFYREISLLGIGEELLLRPYGTLSGGERTKIQLAALFLREGNFLLIDEPTNHLDIEGRQTVANYLNAQKGFILVSHDRNFLDACVDHILSINKANIEVVSGSFSSWYYNKRLRDDYETDKNLRLKKEIKRLDATVRQKANWSDKIEKSKIGTHSADRGYVGHMAAKMMKRSKAIEERKQREVEEKSKLLKNIESSESLKLTPLSFHSQRLIELRDVSLFYPQKQAAQGVNLLIKQGERIALRGKNGSGKSSVLKLICGGDIGFTGEKYVAKGLKISYVPQEMQHLSGGLRAYAKAYNIDETRFKTILRKLDFSRLQLEKDMKDYSDGQKKKVLIARSLAEDAHIYVWDEPLNYIDIFSRMQIEELMLEYPFTLLFVEHDAAFCDAVATKTVFLRDN